MYQRLADNVFISDTVQQESPAVPMDGANAVQVEFVVLSVSGTPTVEVLVQESNDLENWTDVGTVETQSAIGYKTFTRPTVTTGARIGSAYVRVVFRVATGTSGSAVVAAGLNTFAA